MTQPSRGKNDFFWKVFFLTICLTGAVSANSFSKEKNMNQPMTIWALIEKIGSSPSFKKEQIEHLLNAKLSIGSQNDYYTFWEGKSALSLAGDAKITSVDLGLSNPDGEAHAMLTIKTAGACITRHETQAHFPSMQVTGAPRGRSLDDETTFTGHATWGNVTLGFAERNRDCLSSVGFEIKK